MHIQKFSDEAMREARQAYLAGNWAQIPALPQPIRGEGR